MNHTAQASKSLTEVALRATIHCLTGCAIGEILGMVLGTALGLSNHATIALSVALAFVSGFGLAVWPLLGAGLGVGRSLAFASDAASITVMELVDNALMLVIPGAMDAPLDSGLFWGSLLLSLAASGAAAFPLNRWLIARGKGHAVVHGKHAGHGGAGTHAGHGGAGTHAGHGAAGAHAGHGGASAHEGHGGAGAHAGHCCTTTQG